MRYKEGKPCKDCGDFLPPWCLDFDHLNPETKYRDISHMKHQRKELLLKEIAKCDLVCANCHRKRTWKRLQNGKN